MFADKAENDFETYYGYMSDTDKYRNMIIQQRRAIENREDIINRRTLNDLVYLHINSGNWVTYHNTVKSYFEGESMFGDLIEDIRKAERFIHMEYYIIRGDELGGRIVEELAKKAAEGVEVRFLYDGMGNQFIGRDFSKS